MIRIGSAKYINVSFGCYEMDINMM